MIENECRALCVIGNCYIHWTTSPGWLLFLQLFFMGYCSIIFSINSWPLARLELFLLSANVSILLNLNKCHNIIWIYMIMLYWVLCLLHNLTQIISKWANELISQLKDFQSDEIHFHSDFLVTHSVVLRCAKINSKYSCSLTFSGIGSWLNPLELNISVKYLTF